MAATCLIFGMTNKIQPTTTIPPPSPTMKTSDAAGLSSLYAHAWRRLCSSYKSASKCPTSLSDKQGVFEI